MTKENVHYSVLVCRSNQVHWVFDKPPLREAAAGATRPRPGQERAAGAVWPQPGGSEQGSAGAARIARKTEGSGAGRDRASERGAGGGGGIQDPLYYSTPVVSSQRRMGRFYPPRCEGRGGFLE